MGIEPMSEAWEASILPLYDARSTPIVPANRSSEKPSRVLESHYFRAATGVSALRQNGENESPFPNESRILDVTYV